VNKKEFKQALQELGDRVDEQFGFEEFKEGSPRLGWLLNMLPSSVQHKDEGSDDMVELAALEMFFLQQDGSTFKAKILHRPYCYVIVKEGLCMEVKAALERRFAPHVDVIEIVTKEDLDLADHLAGKKRECLQLMFRNVSDMLNVRSSLFEIVKTNKNRSKSAEAYEYEALRQPGTSKVIPENLMDAIEDIREYDVPYYTRVSIDLEINVGSWYSVRPKIFDGASRGGLGVEVHKLNLMEKAEPRILAFDIECMKEPLRFPDPENDPIFMISYMFDGHGYLIINREIVSEDIEDFEYTPKPEFPGFFTVFNEQDEKALLKRFFGHCMELKPNIWVTYNGDNFDWPYVEKRAKLLDLDMRGDLGVQAGKDCKTYTGRCSVHIDCMYWVIRDSYLPAGSRGLKAVTKAKLGYDPVEVDPEDMVRLAREQPTHMASYSVSDAVATYYLYEKYINLFVFSLCTIIPLGPDEVLRRGSGALCEMLLMVEAKRGNIVCPNKELEGSQKFTEDGRLLESETYIGGHVECLETGVFREDIPEKFRLDPEAFDELIQNIDRDLTFAIEVEGGIPRRQVMNYDEVRSAIVEELEMLRDTPTRLENPTLYHLDVAAMYPNIILTNRLQPEAIVDETDCASCSFNTGPDAPCKRTMEWMWRGEIFLASKGEFVSIKNQLERERFEGVPYHELPKQTRTQILRNRVKEVAQRMHGKTKESVIVAKQATVCQRENPFYVDTVKAFRDRRYEYKKFTKKWAKEKSSLQKKMDEGSLGDPLALDEARNKVLIYDSLQLAHKCILNSFYGYVMRKGSRWHSMEMAGIVTQTGGNIIKQATKLVDRIGRPLEIDTDGIWCILPASFPENYAFVTEKGRKIPISYPCVMLNADVHDKFTNHQYQDLVNPETLQYDTKSECSIYFEVDGPYRCMVLPASVEEGKKLKKRYAVFNRDGTLAELKGFELKRRGELKIVKIFQSQVFEKFLHGNSLQECYQAVADIANFWLDVLYTQGKDLSDEEVIDLISENRVMSKSIEEYGDQKSTSISTARRLAEFHGDLEMTSSKGLNTKLLISTQPAGAPISQRAFPAVIFSADKERRERFLQKWLGDRSITDFNVRNIIDWDYYIERLGKTVQKIITIPAALQNITNPVPRLAHPDWLIREVRTRNDPFKQRTLTSLFARAKEQDASKKEKGIKDIEDVVGDTSSKSDDARMSDEAPEGDVVQEDEEGEEVADEMDFESWLGARKRKWDKLIAKKRTGKEMQQGKKVGTHGIEPLDEEEKPAVDFSRGLRDFAQAKDGITEDGYWQVLEVREQGTPGMFKLFVMTSRSQIQTVYVKFRRSFYINSRVPIHEKALPPWLLISNVHRQLPHSQGVDRLYLLEADEEDIRNNPKQMSALVDRPEVLGVYELNVPLSHRLIARIGCVSRVHRHAIIERRRVAGAWAGNSKKNPFREGDIERLVCTTHPYLEGDSAEFRRLFIFHGGVGKRHVVLLFEMQQTSVELESKMMEQRVKQASDPKEDNANIFDLFVTPTSEVKCWAWMTGTGAIRPNLNRILRQASDGHCDAVGMSSNSIDFEMNFASAHVSFANSLEDCWNRLSDTLKVYRDARNGPTVVIMQSSAPKDGVLERVKALHSFPCIWVAHVKEDDEDLPTLQWERTLAQRGMERFLKHSVWLASRISCSRYAHVPLAHVGTDFALTMSDTFFTRLLEHNRHVLWASTSGKPDLGGMECDQALLDEEENPSINATGCYRSYCVEINIYNLAVNTVLQANFVHDIECADGSLSLDQPSVAAVAAGGATQTLDMDGTLQKSANLAGGGIMGSAGACLSAFRILRAMLTHWKNDLGTSEAEFADALMVHFYRWLSSPRSLLFDPSLQRFVHQLMLKVFLQLLAECRRLGAHIVSANFHKLTICTNKIDRRSAEAYCAHILQTVRSRPLFKNIVFEVSSYWLGLLFMDEQNFGAVVKDMDYEQKLKGYEEEMKNRRVQEEERQRRVEQKAKRKQERSMEQEERRKEKKKKDRQEEKEEVDEELQSGDSSPPSSENEEPTKKKRKLVRKKENKVGTKGRSLRARAADGTAITTTGTVNLDLVHEAADQRDEEDGMSEEDDDEFHGSLGKVKARTRFRHNGDDDDEPVQHFDNDDMKDFIVKDDDDSFFGDLGDDEEIEGEKKQQFFVKPEKYNIIMNWNLSTHLPVQVQEPFTVLIAKFIMEPVVERERLFEEEMSRLMEASRHALALDNESSIFEVEDNEVAEENKIKEEKAIEIALVKLDEIKIEKAVERFVLRMLQTKIGPMIFKFLKTIQAYELGPEDFPHLPGSHLMMKNAPLEFVKSMMEIMKLDTNLEDRVIVLRRQLLAAVGVRDFAPETIFRNPSLMLILKDHICPDCNICEDIDLCRDPELIECMYTQEHAENSEIRVRWKCRECQTPFDMAVIEFRLIERLHNLTLAFQTQDLECGKCGQIRADVMSGSCKCSGPWQLTISNSQQRAKILPYFNAAKYYNFHTLHETAQTLFTTIPS